MKQLRLLGILLLLFSSNSYSQANLNEDDKIEFEQLLNDFDGAYQIQMINNRYKPTISLELLKTIKENQLESSDVEFFYRANIRIRVLSKNSYDLGNRIEDEEQIIYLNN